MDTGGKNPLQNWGGGWAVGLVGFREPKNPTSLSLGAGAFNAFEEFPSLA